MPRAGLIFTAALALPRAFGFFAATPPAGFCRSLRTTVSAAAEFGEEGGPDVFDADQIRWLPRLDFAQAPEPREDVELGEGQEILPLFPLGSSPYLPLAQESLSIFEPRYRKMYDDILLSGGRRFAVCMVSPTGAFAEMATVFYLDDLSDVQGQTGNAVKYLSQHTVLGTPVRIERVLNPSAWKDASDYLKVVATNMLEPEEEGGSCDEAEGALMAQFKEVIELQDSLGEAVRFDPEVAARHSAGLADGKLWRLIALWRNFIEQRTQAKRMNLQRGIQEKLLAHLSQGGAVSPEKMPRAVRFEDLPTELQREIKALQRRSAVELEPLMEELATPYQVLLQAPSHAARVELTTELVGLEAKRLRAKRAIDSIFGDMSQDAVFAAGGLQ